MDAIFINFSPPSGEYFVGKEIPVPRPRNTAWTFGLRPHQRRPKSHSPGPKYNPSNDWSSPKGFSFGSASRSAPFRPKDFDLPGPGEYHKNDTKSFYDSRVKGYSFGLRVSENLF